MQRVRVDRTQDEMTWPTNSSSDVKAQDVPVTDMPGPVSASSSKATLIEVKPGSAEEESGIGMDRPASFDLPVLVGDAHSLFRFTMFDRVPPKHVVKKGKKKKELAVKTDDKESHGDTQVKPKLLPKVQNDPPPENLSVTMDSNV